MPSSRSGVVVYMPAAISRRAVVVAPETREMVSQPAPDRPGQVVEARAEMDAAVLDRRGQSPGEAVGADLLDRLRAPAGRSDRAREQRHRDGEEEDPDDENEDGPSQSSISTIRRIM